MWEGIISLLAVYYCHSPTLCAFFPCGKLFLSQKYYTVKQGKKPKVYNLLSEVSSFHHHCLPHLNPLQSRTYKLMSILSIYIYNT